MGMTDRDVRAAAATLYGGTAHGTAAGYQSRPYYPSEQRSYEHSINFITEDFIAGFMQDGRMSVVRRFFCLFVTFDLVFISLLWLISVMITGQNIYDALTKQVLHYNIYSSVFDIVMAAVFRFLILVLCYGCIYTNHWSIIALCTTGSCSFLITKVFYYDWQNNPQPVFPVLLIITSFVLSWGEAWFLDCRVIPQERHARSYYFAATGGARSIDDRAPLLNSFLRSVPSAGVPESIGNFYSPYDSAENSEDEDDAQNEEYKKMGKEFVRRAYDILESSDWKIEKVTNAEDTIQSTHREKLGKIYRLTGRLNSSPEELLEELFYRIESVPKWNPTLLESKIIRKIDAHTDITYQATVGGGGGVVKCRDFVNLRCWYLLQNGNIVEDYILNPSKVGIASGKVNELVRVVEEVVETVENVDKTEPSSKSSTTKIQKSVSDINLSERTNEQNRGLAILSKSLGAKDFNDGAKYVSDESLAYSDAQDDVESVSQPSDTNIFISAAVSIDFPGGPALTQKYIRGQNILSCWAMREIPGQQDSCIFEWLLCLDLKGYIPRYVLDAAYTSLMQDYMKFLRDYLKETNKRKCTKVPQIIPV